MCAGRVSRSRGGFQVRLYERSSQLGGRLGHAQLGPHQAGHEEEQQSWYLDGVTNLNITE